MRPPRKAVKPKSLAQIACEAFHTGWKEPWKNQTAYARRQWKDAAQAVLDASRDLLDMPE